MRARPKEGRDEAKALRPGPAQAACAPLVLATVHGPSSCGLTRQVVALLRANPRRWFKLRELLPHLGQDADKAAVQSALHKLVSRGQVLRQLVDNDRYPQSVRLLVAAYRWRGDGSEPEGPA